MKDQVISAELVLQAQTRLPYVTPTLSVIEDKETGLNSGNGGDGAEASNNLSGPT